MTVTIVGTGLIGGSMALALKRHRIAKKIIGVDSNRTHIRKALELKLIDQALPLNDAIQQSDLIVLAIPVDSARQLVPKIMDRVSTQVVMDVGSTKGPITEAIDDHPKRSRFVGTHPMWGTEHSGPEAAEKNAFKGKVTVITDREKSDHDALSLVKAIYEKLQMKILYMNAIEHDLHTAYVSHISHITSFALANTVLEKEKKEKTIFDLASGGFESTVRLAKSNPAMWVQIFLQNRSNILDVLDEHIHQLQMFRDSIEDQNGNDLKNLITHANKIRKILK
jgi:prephenate dehydrogenase